MMKRAPDRGELARAVGARLKDARLQRGLSQAAAGAAAGFASEYPQARVSHYETGRRPITLADLATLARLYGVNPAFLAFGETSLPEDEENLLRDYRAVSEDTKKIVRAILDTALETGKAGKKGRTRQG